MTSWLRQNSDKQTGMVDDFEDFSKGKGQCPVPRGEFGDLHSIFSGAPAARRAAKRSPILIWERKGNPSMNFLMVIMASGIARGRVRTTATTTTTESRKMAAILQVME